MVTTMMLVNVRRQLGSLACAMLPVMGFLLSCLGAYLMSLSSNQYHYAVRVILGYLLIGCGFLAMLIGVSWAICHGIKFKVNQRAGRAGTGPYHQQVHIYTIDRPSSFPPSYEESQRGYDDTAPDSVVVVDEGSLAMGPAPPLYTQHDSEVPDCTWSWEQPPPYVQTQTGLQGRLAAGAEEQRDAVA